MNNTHRNATLDSLKFYLMILVIIGHVFSQGLFSESSLCFIFTKWIYLFHMPLFVFISGYLTQQKDSKSFSNSSLKIVETLLFFHFLVLIWSNRHGGWDDISRIFTPWWVLWYLLSLLYWRTIIQILPKRLLNKKWLLVVSAFVIGIVAGFLPLTRFLSLQRTCSFLPFFILGYVWQGKQLPHIDHKYKWLCAIFLVATLFIPYFIIDYLGDLNQADPYDNWYDMFKRLLVYCLSIPMSIAFINICPANKYIAQQGQFTMQYYIYHALIISYMLLPVANLFHLPTSFFFALLYSAIIVAMIWIANKLPFIRKLTNPISTLIR